MNVAVEKESIKERLNEVQEGARRISCNNRFIFQIEDEAIVFFTNNPFLLTNNNFPATLYNDFPKKTFIFTAKF